MAARLRQQAGQARLRSRRKASRKSRITLSTRAAARVGDAWRRGRAGCAVRRRPRPARQQARAGRKGVRMVGNNMGDYEQVPDKKKALRKRWCRAPAPARPAGPRGRPAGRDAHLAGGPPGHRDRRLLADQGRVRPPARPAPLEGRRRTAGRAAAPAHRPAGGRQGAQDADAFTPGTPAARWRKTPTASPSPRTPR
jgi:hypothetical protein